MIERLKGVNHEMNHNRREREKGSCISIYICKIYSLKSMTYRGK